MGRTFDIDAIMRDVRAAVNRYPATSATLLQKRLNRSKVADVAGRPFTEIEERAGLADSVPAVYRDAWARLNHQKPEGVTEADWRRALDDGGLFLDQFGKEAAKLRWTPAALFDVGRGLIWNLRGERVLAVGTRGVRLRNGLTLQRRG